MDKKREQQRANANMRWSKRSEDVQQDGEDASAMPRQSHGNAIREDDSTADKNKPDQKRADERVQGEKAAKNFFDHCLQARNAYPITLFFEYVWFVGSNNIASIDQGRKEFLKHWNSSKPLTQWDEIKTRLIWMAKNGFGLDKAQTSEQLNRFTRKEYKGEYKVYQEFVKVLKGNGFRPVEGLIKLAGSTAVF